MLTLFHHPLCPHSRYVRLILAEYGIDARLVEERFWERREEFLLLNPAGGIPVLVADGQPAIPGAAIIAEYIEETRPPSAGEDRLLPPLAGQRVEVRRLASWFNDKFHAEASGPLVAERVFKRHMTLEQGGGPPDTEAMRAARNNIRYHLAYIGWLVRTRDWLAGDRLSLADLAAAAHLSAADYLGDVPWNADEAAKNKAALIAQARTRGFDVVGVTRPDAVPEAKARLERFLADGAHGDMIWMASTAERRASPSALWPEVRSVIMLGMNYGPDEDPLAILKRGDRAAISVYAKGEDYHELIKARLKEVARWLVENSGGDVKVFVDTAAVMEKPLAEKAGLGWQGKHTNLVSRQFGSWLFLGSIFTTLDLPADTAEPDSCGSCRACLDICPTAAFPEPYRLDARRCISYLTIEYKGPIPREFRAAMGNRIYGLSLIHISEPTRRTPI